VDGHGTLGDEFVFAHGVILTEKPPGF